MTRVEIYRIVMEGAKATKMGQVLFFVPTESTYQVKIVIMVSACLLVWHVIFHDSLQMPAVTTKVW